MAQGAELAQLRLERNGDGVYLNAAVQFELPALVEEVLDKGIAVYFVAEAELFRERWYWTDQKVAQVVKLRQDALGQTKNILTAPQQQQMSALLLPKS